MCSRATLGGLRRAEKRAVVKFIVVVVPSRGNEGEASRLCSWIVKIADLYVVFIAAHSRGRYEREIQALPGTAASLPEDFFFFSFPKVAYYAYDPPLERSFSRSGGTREPRRHMARKRSRARRKTFTPRGAYVVVVPRWCARTSRPPEPGDAGLSDYVFPGRRRENAPRPLWRKSALDFWREAPVTGALDVYIFENAISLHDFWNLSLFRWKRKRTEFLFIYLLFIHHVCHLYIYLFMYFPKVLYIPSCLGDLWNLFHTEIIYADIYIYLNVV